MNRVVYIHREGKTLVPISREYEGYSFPLNGEDYGFYPSIAAAIEAAHYFATQRFHKEQARWNCRPSIPASGP